ncbi:MAG: sugar transferase [Bacteroidales bacterium]|jgi:lipopolysaccharide/colanic/teichoic acid biosynthesis glycosyltransferase|nr:sugar transferase [Bacteroidales bacterium]
MYRNFLKRLIDIVLSGTALLILSPLLIPVIIGLVLTGEHYVFYFQKRIGYRNRPFDIWKFATMLKASPNLPGGIHTTRNDPRLMPMGGFLRKTKINEIPQLVNILKGDMSIVGPRPLVDRTFDPYPDHVKANIYNVRPGLTGIGSVVFRDEERLLSETRLDKAVYYATHISPYKGELELWYQKHLSLYTDLMLIFLTAWVVFFPESGLTYRVFRDLPGKPEVLKNE